MESTNTLQCHNCGNTRGWRNLVVTKKRAKGICGACGEHVTTTFDNSAAPIEMTGPGVAGVVSSMTDADDAEPYWF